MYTVEILRTKQRVKFQLVTANPDISETQRVKCKVHRLTSCNNLLQQADIRMRLHDL